LGNGVSRKMLLRFTTDLYIFKMLGAIKVP
jgi:hypothetical protein